MSCLFSQQSFELTAAPEAARARRRAGGIIYTAAALRRDLCIKGALKHVIPNDSLAIIYPKVANHPGNLYEQPIFHGPKGLPADEKEGSAEKKIRDFIFKSLYRGKPWVACSLAAPLFESSRRLGGFSPFHKSQMETQHHKGAPMHTVIYKKKFIFFEKSVIQRACC